MNQLVRRALISIVKPLPIGVEWLFTDQTFFVRAYTIALLVLAVTSIPVHREMYLQSSWTGQVRKKYITSLTILISAVLIFFYISSFYFTKSLSLLAAGIFVLEKLLDELARSQSYQKKLSHWEAVTFLRALLPGVFVSYAAFFSPDYVIGSLMLFSCAATIGFFILVVQLRSRDFNLWITAIDNVFSSAPYALGGVLSGLVRQAPKNIVAVAYSEFLQLYAIASQLFSIITVLYNVKLVVPYRAIISKKPRRYASAIISLNVKLLIIALSISLAGSALAYIVGIGAPELPILAATLGEVMGITVFANVLGLMSWAFKLRSFVWSTVLILALWCVCIVAATAVPAIVGLHGAAGVTVFISLSCISAAAITILAYWTLQNKSDQI